MSFSSSAISPLHRSGERHYIGIGRRAGNDLLKFVAPKDKSFPFFAIITVAIVDSGHPTFSMIEDLRDHDALGTELCEVSCACSPKIVQMPLRHLRNNFRGSFVYPLFR